MESIIDKAMKSHFSQVEFGKSKLDVQIHELVIGAVHLPGGCHHVADHTSEHRDNIAVEAVVEAEVDRL